MLGGKQVSRPLQERVVGAAEVAQSLRLQPVLRGSLVNELIENSIPAQRSRVPLESGGGTNLIDQLDRTTDAI